MQKFNYHVDGTGPQHQEIFVFGSNLAGVHGAGAAKKARQYGAIMGQGVGLAGFTYAIPTKDEEIETLNLITVTDYVQKFCDLTHSMSGVNWFITRVGCGLAGYTDKQIAPLFKSCKPGVCSFAEQWRSYLE